MININLISTVKSFDYSISFLTRKPLPDYPTDINIFHPQGSLQLLVNMQNPWMVVPRLE